MILRRRKFLIYLFIVFSLLIFTGYLVNFNDDKPRNHLNFDTNKNLLVFLHIQKTGGSDFDRNVVKHLLRFNNISQKWSKACVTLNQLTSKTVKKFVKFKKYKCPRESNSLHINDNLPSWYFSRQTYGWGCGLHADYTRLKNCLSNKHVKNPLIITILRDPLKRYLSEWKHINRGATWNRSKNICNKENQCFQGRNLSSVTIQEFLDCNMNTANNRQTRMLAKYNEADTTCTHLTKQISLLENAKKTLLELKYFALNEYQLESQWLFEKMFSGDFKFSIKLEQSQNEYSSKLLNVLNQTLIEKIKEVNKLDVKLYEFACKLFFDRIDFYKNKN
jgi:hypothetical protein